MVELINPGKRVNLKKMWGMVFNGSVRADVHRFLLENISYDTWDIVAIAMLKENEAIYDSWFAVYDSLTNKVGKR